MTFSPSRVLASALVAALAFGSVSCSATNSDGNVFGNGSGGASTGGSGGGTDSDASVTTDGAAGDSGVFIDASIGEGSMNADSACAAEHAKAEQLPLDLYLMVDRSGSMDGSPWVQQSSALNQFFNDPGSTGLYVAMRFFPLDDNCGPQDSACSGAKYVKPLVDWGQLPGLAPTLSQAINGTFANGCFTPTQEAIQGAMEGAKQRQIAQPQHVVAAVIVSDGEPCCGDCPIEDATGIGNLAGNYFNGTPSIRTFAVYVADAASDVMSAIAQKGGTNTPYDATGGSASLLAALNAIRGSMLACEYKVPVPEAGTVNPDQVEVEFTPSGATDPIKIPRKHGSGDCGNDPGWYYDDDANPTKLIFCPATCSMLQNDQDGKLDILLGCSSGQY